MFSLYTLPVKAQQFCERLFCNDYCNCPSLDNLPPCCDNSDARDTRPCCDPPSATTLSRCSTALHCTAAGLLIGGLVTISVVAHSTLPGDVKVAACAISGVVMAGACVCCRLSTMLADQAYAVNCLGRMSMHGLFDV